MPFMAFPVGLRAAAARAPPAATLRPRCLADNAGLIGAALFGQCRRQLFANAVMAASRVVRPANADTSISPSTRRARVLPLQQGTGRVGPALVEPQGTVRTLIPLQQAPVALGPRW
jgi:hypothetical protein